MEEALRLHRVRTRAGQRAEVSLVSAGNRASFRLRLPDGTMVEDAAGNAGHRHYWSAPVRGTGDCRVAVSQGAGAPSTTYTLCVKLH